jgi:hypothetical protein
MVDSLGEIAELFGTVDRILLMVAHRDSLPMLHDLVDRARRRPDVAVVQVRPELIDPGAPWFRLMAAPKLRRLQLPDDRVVTGFYLFERERLVAWHPLSELAGEWIDGLFDGPCPR